MDSSQLTRLRNEAANLFVSRTKTVDSSLLTMKTQQRAAYAGAARFNTPAYYKGAPTVNPILYNASDCPANHSYSDGYESVTSLNQQESLANERGGAAICGDSDYSVGPQFIYLQNLSTCNTILTSYNNNVSFPSGPDGPPASAGLSSAEWAAVNASSNGGPMSINPLLDIGPFVRPTLLPSIYFQGNGFIQVSQDTVYPSSGMYTTGANDFTLEFFIQPTIVGPATQTIFYAGISANATTYKMMGDLVLTQVSGGFNQKYNFNLKVSTFSTVTIGELLPGEWTHITVMRYGSNIYYFQNGTLMGSINIGAGIPSNSGTTNYLSGAESILTIGGKYDAGYSGLANAYDGYLSSFRWTKGAERYLLKLDNTIKVPTKFKVPDAPLFIDTRNTAFLSLVPYVSLGLLAQSSGTLLTNTRSASATVSVQDGNTINASYTPLSWRTA